MRIGIDLGGTKTEAIALLPDGTATIRRRTETPKHQYAATIDTIVGLVRDIEHETGKSGTVGVGVPGALSPGSGTLKNANSTWLIGKPLDRDLSHALERPVRLANDADCFALSEAVDGAGSGHRMVFGAILGTGVGGGVVVGEKLLSGPNALAGEWGHNPLPWPTDAERPGPRCYCGKTGCIETFLSGPGLAADLAHQMGDAGPTAAEIVVAASQNDGPSVEALRRYCDRLARALATVVNLLDPDVIVLGGGLSNTAALYDELPALMGTYVFGDDARTPVRPAFHGDSSGVRGAAWLWPDAGEND